MEARCPVRRRRWTSRGQGQKKRLSQAGTALHTMVLIKAGKSCPVYLCAPGHRCPRAELWDARRELVQAVVLCQANESHSQTPELSPQRGTQWTWKRLPGRTGSILGQITHTSQLGRDLPQQGHPGCWGQGQYGKGPLSHPAGQHGAGIPVPPHTCRAFSSTIHMTLRTAL